MSDEFGDVATKRGREYKCVGQRKVFEVICVEI